MSSEDVDFIIGDVWFHIFCLIHIYETYSRYECPKTLTNEAHIKEYNDILKTIRTRLDTLVKLQSLIESTSDRDFEEYAKQRWAMYPLKTGDIRRFVHTHIKDITTIISDYKNNGHHRIFDLRILLDYVNMVIDQVDNDIPKFNQLLVLFYTTRLDISSEVSETIMKLYVMFEMYLTYYNPKYMEDENALKFSTNIAKAFEQYCRSDNSEQELEIAHKTYALMSEAQIIDSFKYIMSRLCFFPQNNGGDVLLKDVDLNAINKIFPFVTENNAIRMPLHLINPTLK